MHNRCRSLGDVRDSAVVDLLGNRSGRTKEGRDQRVAGSLIRRTALPIGRVVEDQRIVKRLFIQKRQQHCVPARSMLIPAIRKAAVQLVIVV